MTRRQIKKVFLVDDEPAILKVLGNSLKDIGCKVTKFADARECLTNIVRNDCGLLITDVNMPGMDGMTLLHEVKKVRPQLPVLIITGYGDIPMAVEAVKAGAIDFIEKPLDEETFIPIVESALSISYGPDGQGDKALTPSELRILSLICDGHSNKQMAAILSRSVRTIENHRHRIMRKLNVDNAAELVRTALKMGIQID